MTQFTVTATWILDADNAKEAAIKTFALAEELTPHEFTVNAGDLVDEFVELSEDEQKDAIRRHLEGTLFLDLAAHEEKHLGVFNKDEDR